MAYKVLISKVIKPTLSLQTVPIQECNTACASSSQGTGQADAWPLKSLMQDYSMKHTHPSGRVFLKSRLDLKLMTPQKGH